MNIGDLQEILKIREFNKNFSNSLYKTGSEIFEQRENQLYALGYKLSKNGEYYTKSKNKIATIFLNFITFDDEYWNEMLMKRKSKL